MSEAIIDLRRLDEHLMTEPTPEQRDILLATINARYIHSAFGLRYLYANMGALQERTSLCEWVIKKPVQEMVEEVLTHKPKILGLGVYIWNVVPATHLVQLLKRLMPELLIILGGPEVSYETEQQVLVQEADYVITGEADLAFGSLCEQLLRGERPTQKVHQALLPAVDHIALPYSAYTDTDIANRVAYVEMSRGCPFRCEFCLSSLEIPVRKFDIDAFLAEMDGLYKRGLQQFKFVDRTFNLNIKLSQRILDFFYERYRPGLFLHFEMVPDRFPEALRESVKRFPPGALQFEVGIQTFHPEVAARISRRQDYEKLEDNLRFLREETGVHVHADLIAGLPGEDLKSFGAGFDRLVTLAPQEIQLGILKRLRGAPILRHEQEWGLVFDPHPPYEILQSSSIDFPTMRQLARFSKYWDKYGNSGNFLTTLPLLWAEGASPFWSFWAFSDWLYKRVNKTHSLSLPHLMKQLFLYLTEAKGHQEAAVASSMLADYLKVQRPGVPAFLKPYSQDIVEPNNQSTSLAPTRQARHL